LDNTLSIIQGCLLNDRISQEQLYMQVYDKLYGMCNRYFTDEHEIISAINNGMLRVFKFMHLYDKTQADIQTWIYTIVRNEALTIVRNKKNLTITKELSTDLEIASNFKPFDENANEETQLYLSKLPETTRAIFTLFYLENLSIKEVAKDLEMKEGTVKWHLSEGRKKLQTIFNFKDEAILNAGSFLVFFYNIHL
jgi:RNA polymerase sigma factor (sigma-70 family)